MAFRKGQGGRPKGAQNKVKRALREFAESMMNDPDWQASARERCLAGKAPHIETHFLSVGLPKPKDGFSVESKDGVTVFRWAGE